MTTTYPRRGESRWIDTEGGFIGATWYWPSAVPAGGTAVVIVPGIVHEERTMAGGLVVLAQSLAAAGLPALLIDLHGCSQSAGRLEDPDSGARWRADIRAAVAHARSSGAARVIVIGVRLGFTLAAEALAGESLGALIAWAPIASGKRYVRELKVLQRTADAAVGTIAIGGFSIPASVLERIADLDLGRIDPPDATYMMLRETPEGLNAPWVARWRERGLPVQEQVSTQIHPWLFGATDRPEIPHDDIQALTRWCRVQHERQAARAEPVPSRPAPRPTIEFIHQGRLVRETFVEIGPSRLTGVLSEPADPTEGHAVRLLMSTVGPGRTFTDFARDEASVCNSSLRFDFAGFGTSGHGDAMGGGELYTDQGSRDVQAAIAYLRETGCRDIYTLGYCAGAWSMLQAGVAPELRAAVAINAQLYYQPGPATPALAQRTRRRLIRLSPLIARHPLLKGFAARMRRAAGKRREPIEWLIRLCSTDVQVLLAYADLDPGLNYLNGQIAQGIHAQLVRPFTLQTYAGLGHLAEGPSARRRLFRDIADYFANLDREASNSGPLASRSHRSSNRSPLAG